jgi:hypothetical protein
VRLLPHALACDAGRAEPPGEIGRLQRVEPGQLHDGAARFAAEGNGCGTRSGRGHEEERCRAPASGQPVDDVTHDGEGRAVGPLQVVEEDEQRPVHRGPEEQVGQLEQQLRRRGLVPRLVVAVLVLATRDDERVRRPGTVVEETGQLGKDVLAQGQERHRDVVVAAADERVEAVGFRVLEQLQHEAGLADAGRSADEHALR